MIRSYFVVALRNLRKNPIHMGLSLLGLAAGLACFLVISLYVRDELSYDRFHEKGDRIYRVGLDVPGASDSRWAPALYPHADLLSVDLSEVEAAVRIQKGGMHIIASDDVRDYEERVFYVEPSFFEVFDFNVLAGRTDDLARPNTVFLTPAASEKYFGSADPMGRRLTLDNETELEVAGIVASAPSASHIQFDLLVSLATNEAENVAQPWSRLAFTYVLLRPTATLGEFERRLSAFSERHVEPYMSNASLSAIPLTRIHLFGNFSSDLQPQGDYRYVLLFSTVAFLILLIACINYVTLVTARSTDRAREVGIRKAVGASRAEVMAQFFGEAVVFTLIALGVAIVIIWTIMPSIQMLLGRELPIRLEPGFLLILGATLLGVIVICGGYPALVLSRFTPVNIFKGILPSMKAPRLRRALLVFQFAVSIALIGGSLVIERQLSYVQETRLGFNRENVLIIETRGGLEEQAPAFKQELLRHAGVARVSLAYAAPSRPFGMAAIGPDSEGDQQLAQDEHVLVEVNWVDHDFIAAMGMELREGRDFSEAMPTDEAAMVINETAQRAFGWNEPLGKTLMGHTVVGVVRDFHTHSLHEPVRPVFLQFDPAASNRIVIRVRGGNVARTIDEISETWASFVPSIPFDYSFIDQEFDAMYKAEQRLGRIFVLFTTLALILSCLGLVGVSSFLVQQRTKEIGIRKVLGASSGAVVRLLSKEIVVLAAIAAVIGSPLAYVFTSRWLESFAYRTPDGIWIIAASAGIGFVLAMIAAGSQSWRAALANPADSLRSE